jgi:hypothetical protein
VAALLLVPVAATGQNLALEGTARSCLDNSVPTVAPALVNDGDPLSWWGSNQPTREPPKDIGIEWAVPREFSSVRVHFHSMGYVPAREGWRLEARSGGQWRRIPAVLSNPDCERWTFRFQPVSADAVRLVVTAYRSSRPAVGEFEVYAEEPPAPDLRRAPLLDGAFWQFQHARWAERWDDEALAAEVDRAHEIGLDTLMLYTLTGRDGDFATVVPDAPLRQIPAWEGRDPLEVILSRADALGMTVYLGDAQPTGYSEPGGAPAEVAESTERLNAYRRELLERYGEHPSLVGYYLNFELCPANFGNDPAGPARQMQQLARFITDLRPDLQLVMPLGLYRWREEPDGAWARVSREQLRTFWRPFIESVPDVDVVMVIDGVGTGLSTLHHTDMAQQTVRAICDDLGKTMWSDVECAVMGRGVGFHAFPIERLIPSIEVAAKHAERIVTFDYPNYLSPTNGREASAALYEDYAEYRNTVLGRW